MEQGLDHHQRSGSYEAEAESAEIPLTSIGSCSPNHGELWTYSNSQESAESTNSQAYDHSSEQGSGPEDYFNLRIPPPPGHEHRETYIIRMPRDQIFYVPPPENCNIVKHLRQPAVKKRRKIRFRTTLPLIYTFAAILATVGLVCIGLVLLLKPLNPEFAVTKLVFKNSTRQEYDVFLLAKNPNKRTFTISYTVAQYASLFYNRKSFAEGGFQAFEQGPDESTEVRLSLSSRKRSSLTVKKSNAPLKFSLEIEMLIRSKLSVLPALRSRNMSVKCEFQVYDLAAKTKIFAQKCTTILHL